MQFTLLQNPKSKIQNLIVSFSIIQNLKSIIFPFQVYAQEGIYDGVAGMDWIITLLKNVLAVALQLIGITAFVMLIVGSFKMLTSSGDPKAAESAKSTMSMAIGGLVVAVLAWFIFDIIADVTNVTGILNVSIPTMNDTGPSTN